MTFRSVPTVMKTMKKRCLIAMLAVLVPAADAAAQMPDRDVSAYLALIWSPVGALPPMVQGFDIGARAAGSLRYGHLTASGDDDASFNNVGLTLELPVAYGSARTSVTISRASSNCETCNAAIGIGTDVELIVASSTPSAGQLTVSVKPGLGFAIGSGNLDFSLFTAHVGLPVALRTDAAVSFMPYLVPGVGYGMVSGTGESVGGVRAMLGGGVRVQSDRSGFGGMLGFQKVFISGGGTLLGVGVTYGLR